MIRFRLKERIAAREFDTGRRVTFNEVAAATGINRATLSKIANQRGYNTTTDNLDRLCVYFGCRLDELAEHIPEEEGNEGQSSDTQA